MSKEDVEHIKSILKENKNYIFEFDDDNIKIEYIVEYIEQLETDNKNLIEKLENDISKANEIINDQEYKYIDEVIDEQWVRRKYAQEILKIAKGEKYE